MCLYKNRKWLEEKYCKEMLTCTKIGEKYLSPEWVPHHINEVRYDNRPSNLSVMPMKSHSRYHNYGWNTRYKNMEFRRQEEIP